MIGYVLRGKLQPPSLGPCVHPLQFSNVPGSVQKMVHA